MSWLLLHGLELRRRGVQCDYWFCQRGDRSADFENLSARYGEAKELIRDLESGTYDLVHIVNDDPLRDLLCEVRPQPRVVVTSHSNLAKWSSAQCTAYTAVSRGLADANQPLTDLEIEIVRNAVDCARFTPPKTSDGGRPIIAWAGRTSDPQKDFARFTRIAAALPEENFRFWVADAHGGSWKTLPSGNAHTLVAIERWEKISYADMPDFYRQVAAGGGILLLTSRYEGLGMVVLEAAACGLATVGINVGGIHECIQPGKTGVLFPPEMRDTDVARLLADWIAQGHSEQRIRDCAEFVHQEFSPAKMASKYLEIYGRRGPRLRTDRNLCCDEKTPGMNELLAKYAASPARRANTLRAFARQLASENKPVSRRALLRSVQLDPGACVRPEIMMNVLKTAAMLAMKRSSNDAGAHVANG
jgi:glycosyltransferase involved in cell wall biosynthesis